MLEFRPGYFPMLDAELLKSVASQLMTGTSVDVGGKSIPVRRTSRQHLKTAAFSIESHEYEAIEQNPEKLGIPVKVNIDSGGKPNGVPERR